MAGNVYMYMKQKDLGERLDWKERYLHQQYKEWNKMLKSARVDGYTQGLKDVSSYLPPGWNGKDLLHSRTLVNTLEHLCGKGPQHSDVEAPH